MSKTNLGRQTTRRLAIPTLGTRGLLLAALLLAVALTGGRWSGVAAQEATPGPMDATPTVECVPAAGDATPAVTTAGMEASPAATPEPVGTEADDDTAAALAEAAENVVACFNAGNLSAFLSLVTDRFVAEDLGYASKDEAAQELTGDLAAGELAQLTSFEADPATALTYDDGRASIEVTYMQFQYQYVEARWFFVMSGSDYLLDEEQFLVPVPDVEFVTVISATVPDDETAAAFDQSTSIPVTEAVVIHLDNAVGTVDRDFALIQLPEGTTATPAPDDGVVTVDQASVEAGTIVGYLPVAAGAEEQMALIGLPPGTYALVDIQVDGVAVLEIAEPAA